MTKFDYKMAERIEVWPVEQLIPYDKNPRTHSAEQIGQIAASIAEFGFLNPILVDTTSGIIAGHGRLAAVKQLGLMQVPVVVLDHLTENQKRAYVIADNKLAENAGWNEELLREEIETLMADNFSLSLTGFSDEELEDLLSIPTTADENESDIPNTPENPITKLGDVWILGDHRLLCADSTKIENVELVMNGSLADMVFTDPPYNINYGEAARNAIRGNKRKILNDNIGEDFEFFLQQICANLIKLCKGSIYISISNSYLHVLNKAFCDAGGQLSTFIIWAKNHFNVGKSDYQHQYEPILYGWKNGIKHYWCGARDQSDLWQINKPFKNDLHPTMKPVELVVRAINNSSKHRDIILDCFGGSGTTVIACEKTGRYARVIEMDEKYCDVIVKRWENFTGRKAELFVSNVG